MIKGVQPSPVASLLLCAYQGSCGFKFFKSLHLQSQIQSTCLSLQSGSPDGLDFPPFPPASVKMKNLCWYQ